MRPFFRHISHKKRHASGTLKRAFFTAHFCKLSSHYLQTGATKTARFKGVPVGFQGSLLSQAGINSNNNEEFIFVYYISLFQTEPFGLDNFFTLLQYTEIHTTLLEK